MLPWTLMDREIARSMVSTLDACNDASDARQKNAKQNTTFQFQHRSTRHGQCSQGAEDLEAWNCSAAPTWKEQRLHAWQHDCHDSCMRYSLYVIFQLYWYDHLVVWIRCIARRFHHVASAGLDQQRLRWEDSHQLTAYCAKKGGIPTKGPVPWFWNSQMALDSARLVFLYGYVWLALHLTRKTLHIIAPVGQPWSTLDQPCTRMTRSEGRQLRRESKGVKIVFAYFSRMLHLYAGECKET